MIRAIIKKILGKEMCDKICILLNPPSKIAERYFAYNRDRLVEHSGALGSVAREMSTSPNNHELPYFGEGAYDARSSVWVWWRVE